MENRNIFKDNKILTCPLTYSKSFKKVFSQETLKQFSTPVVILKAAEYNLEIKIKILKIYQDKKTVIVELLISINNCEAKYVIDLIEFDKKNKIKYIKAYLGS